MTADPEPAPDAASPDGPAVERAFRAALQRLSAALRAALDAAGVQAARPRHAARALGVDKTLMWRVSRIVGQADVFRAVGHVPHRAGFDILAGALTRAGLHDGTLAELRGAVEAFERLVERHAGDRATFELMAAGFGRGEHRARSLEQGRRLAFRGNSAVWGVQARQQLLTAILLPSGTDPDLVDLVHVFGFVDLRRLRHDRRWTLSRRQAFGRVSRETGNGACEPLDHGASAAGDLLLRRFSSSPFPELLVEEQDGEQRHVLPAGTVGRTSEMTALFGCRYRALGSRFATPEDAEFQVVANLFTPVEHLLLDLLVHEDLGWSPAPRVALRGCLEEAPRNDADGLGGVELPCPERVVDLGAASGGLATPRVPAYDALLAWVFERIGADPARFRALRFELPYPPIPARAVLSAPLLAPDDAARHDVAAGQDARPAREALR